MDDIGSGLPWGSLPSFLENIGLDSALALETHPQEASWASTLRTNVILADIYDAIAQLNANLVAIGSGKRAEKAKPYPRPFKRKDKNRKHIGGEPMPANELEKWFEERREKKNG